MTPPKSTAPSALSRRALLVNGAVTAAVAALPKKSTASQKEETMTPATATEQGGTQAADKTAIRPFPLPAVSDADLADLRTRINATNWPDPKCGPDPTH